MPVKPIANAPVIPPAYVNRLCSFTSRFTPSLSAGGGKSGEWASLPLTNLDFETDPLFEVQTFPVVSFTHDTNTIVVTGDASLALPVNHRFVTRGAAVAENNSTEKHWLAESVTYDGGTNRTSIVTDVSGVESYIKTARVEDEGAGATLFCGTLKCLVSGDYLVTKKIQGYSSVAHYSSRLAKVGTYTANTGTPVAGELNDFVPIQGYNASSVSAEAVIVGKITLSSGDFVELQALYVTSSTSAFAAGPFSSLMVVSGLAACAQVLLEKI